MGDAEHDLDASIRAVLRDEGLHVSYLGLVRTYVEDRRDQWRVCCGSDCDPCVLHLGRVVDRVRALVRGGGPG